MPAPAFFVVTGAQKKKLVLDKEEIICKKIAPVERV